MKENLKKENLKKRLNNSVICYKICVIPSDFGREFKFLEIFRVLKLGNPLDFRSVIAYAVNFGMPLGTLILVPKSSLLFLFFSGFLFLFTFFVSFLLQLQEHDTRSKFFSFFSDWLFFFHDFTFLFFISKTCRWHW